MRPYDSAVKRLRRPEPPARQTSAPASANRPARAFTMRAITLLLRGELLSRRECSGARAYILARAVRPGEDNLQFVVDLESWAASHRRTTSRPPQGAALNTGRVRLPRRG